MRGGSRAMIGLAVAALLVAGGCSSRDDDRADESAAGAAAIATATTTAAPARPVTEAQLQAFADDLVAETGADGGIVAWRVGDEEPLVVTAGQTAADGGRAPRREDAFHVASITKSFVAAALVLLAADDAVDLDLDDPLGDHVDWPGGADITVRHLLDQTSGLARFGNAHQTPEEEAAYFDLLQQGGAITLADTLAAARDLPPVAAPGEGTAYSNLNYVLAGAVIEAVTGQDVDAVLQERLFTPLGMGDTWYPPQRAGDAEPLPGLYDVDAGVPVLPTSTFDMEPWRTITAPAAGAVSTLDDLLTWTDAVLRDHEIGGVDVAAMTDIGPGGYGLGVAGVTDDGACIFDGCAPDQAFTRWGLNGDIPGSSTRVLHDPATDATLVVYLDRNALELDGPMLDFVTDGAAG